MRCNRFIPGTKTKVDNVWEVRVPNEIWSKVVRAAELENKTFSWIVRWCVFTALQAKNRKSFLAAVTEFRNRGNVNASNTETHHRCQLCLYGQDQTWLKLTSIELETSVTCLILSALTLFLGDFLLEKVSSRDILEHGIKIMAKCNLEIKLLGEYPEKIERQFLNSINILQKNIRSGVIKRKYSPQ